MLQINGSRLITEQGMIDFQQHVHQAVEVAGVVVVLLSRVSEPDDLDNVFGVKNGQIIWQIQPQKEFNSYIWSPFGDSQGNPYAGISVYKENCKRLIATDADGFRYLVDPANGKILEQVDWVR